MEKLLKIIEICQKNGIEHVVENGKLRVFPGVLEMTVYVVDINSNENEINELMEAIEINIETKRTRNEIKQRYNEFINLQNKVFLSFLTEDEKELFYFFNINK